MKLVASSLRFPTYEELWRESQAINFGIENTSGGKEAGENDQFEELSNASNGFGGHDNNEGKNFDDEKHFKTLSEVSMDSNKK